MPGKRLIKTLIQSKIVRIIKMLKILIKCLHYLFMLSLPLLPIILPMLPIMTSLSGYKRHILTRSTKIIIKKTSKRDELHAYQCSKYKKLGLIVFGYILYKNQIDEIYILFYKWKDLFLLIKIDFSKNLIFWLLPFLSSTFNIVLMLILLKLF